MRKILTLKFLGILLMLTCAMQAQQKTVTGTVTDGLGIPLAGATVAVKGTNSGASTDFDGKFSLSVGNNDVLVVSYIGFVTQEITVGQKSTINVSLKEDTAQLDEVVVVGFGTQKKSNVTGANSYVKMDKIVSDRPITNAAEALQGIASGLQVTVGSGQPGSEGVSLNVRGFTSINGGSPLVLINNVPGSLNDVNPQDIESVSVLKDAAASSIYGARAAFGVIVITTKQGKRNQKVKFDYNVTSSISTPSDLPEKATTKEFVRSLEFWGVNAYFAGQNISDWLGYINQYETDPSQLNLAQDPVSGQTYPIHFDGGQYYPLQDADTFGDFIENFGYSTIHNFAVSGGSENIAYRLNTGYSYQDGVMVTDKDSFRKYNVNALISADISEKLTSTSNVLFRSSIQSRPNGRYNDAVQVRMFDPSSGFFDDGSGLVLPFQSPSNVVRFSEPGRREDDNLRLFQKLEWKPLKNLSVTGEYTFEKNYVNNRTVNNGQRYYSTFRFNPNTSEANAQTSSSISRNQSNRIYNGINLYANYNLTLGENHNIGVLVGLNKEDEKQNFFFATKRNLIDPLETPSLNLGFDDTNVNVGDAFYEWGVVGYFSRLNYNYKEKYFIEGNLRYDGSSLFADGDRYVVLPSASVGWNIAKEGFMENVDFVSLLKFRASYGVIGNQVYNRPGTNSRDYFPTIPGYEDFTTRWTDINTEQRYISFSPAGLISAGFTWEDVESRNFGLDFGLAQNRLTGSFDYYVRETNGILGPGAELPAVLGTNAPLQNSRDIEVTGWEFELGWNDRRGDFSYGLNLNVFDNIAKVTRFDNPSQDISQVYWEGSTIGDIWGYVTDGYYTTDDFVDGTLNADLSGDNRQLKPGVPIIDGAPVPYPGDIKYQDLDGDGVITNGNNSASYDIDPNTGEIIARTGPGDRKVIGNGRKRYQFGINGFLEYKGFDFSFVLSGVGKEDGWRDSDLIFPYRSVFDNIYANQLDYWTPDNQNAYFPRVHGNAAAGNIDSNYGLSRRVQTKYLQDESYLRIQNITFGYSIDSELLRRMKINKFRVFVSGNNLFTFDNLPKGLDPDVNEDAASTYPILRQFSAGLNLSF
ncbi:TonB-linked outer membrane protein, SusC/RagA family [Hyunsoonleella jejuensis]|uniref:TonB-linked outer membrane protein, SusC/RagA family n=1 Tax=Hyunsoonleella jejuensis TaxID=419940 RepID=A0A1H9CCS1_9FLAO|nr:TonB-dependent receptor [Hyunsoonleella jejuensis]SEP98944.1 TonB-linked outer membrane protein, SusC/RagA family [Hyunsoonleella jejuensis]